MLLDRKGIAWEKQLCRGHVYNYFEAGHLDEFDHFLSDYNFCNYDARTDPDLIAIIEALGERSWGQYAELKIIDVPEDVKWHIVDYDGREHIAEDHDTWY
jgi:hypothetical protein